MPDVTNVYNIKKVTVRTTISAKTSPALEEELRNHDIEALPADLREELDDIIHHPDFDPDKLAAVLAAARAEQEHQSSKEKDLPERCPWYVAVCRIFSVLSVVGLCYMSCIALLSLFLKCFDATLGTWQWACAAIANHPALTIILAIAGYLAFLLYICYMTGKRLCGE